MPYLVTMEDRISRNTNSISHMEHGMLVEHYQNGEPGAFDEIVERYRGRVYSLAYQFTHNCEDAYDISQEVFIKVFRSLGNLKKSSRFDTWLRTVTVNTCIDYLRRQPDEQALDDFHYLGDISNTELPNAPLEAGELRNMILRAVDRLSEKQRRVFILRYYEQLSLKEVAKTLKCPLGTVKAHLFHATRRLRKLLLPYVS